MKTPDLFARYQELQRYVGWTEADPLRLRQIGLVLEPHFPAIIEDFYCEIQAHPRASQVITGGAEQVARLKGTLLQWMQQLFSGEYDAAYVARRSQVGQRHVAIGLDQVYANAALSRMRNRFMQILCSHWTADREQLALQLESLLRVMDLDLAIIEEAYWQEHLRHAKRLAAIGQAVTGLAHESRNALQRSQACLEMLEMEVGDKPAALDLIRRLQRAQDHLHKHFEDVRNYAAPIQLERHTCRPADLWREAWEQLAVQRQGRQAALEERVEAADASLRVDRFRLVQVLRNILENSLAACSDPVKIRIQSLPTVLWGAPAVRISVADNGPGLSAEQKRRIFEPFFTTKTQGTGLGMAIAERMVEAHGGTLAVGDAPSGAEILLTLPAT